MRGLRASRCPPGFHSAAAIVITARSDHRSAGGECACPSPRRSRYRVRRERRHADVPPPHLHRMSTVRIKALDGYDLFARDLGDLQPTGAHRLTAEVECGGATQCDPTAELGPG